MSGHAQLSFVSALLQGTVDKTQKLAASSATANLLLQVTNTLILSTPQLAYDMKTLSCSQHADSNIKAGGQLQTRTLPLSGHVAASTIAWLVMPRMAAGFRLATINTRRCCISASGMCFTSPLTTVRGPA
jgi:hypothetical protein